MNKFNYSKIDSVQLQNPFASVIFPKASKFELTETLISHYKWGPDDQTSKFSTTVKIVLNKSD